MLDQVKSGDAGTQVPADLDVAKQLRTQRQAICDSCEHIKAYVCTQCHCFLPFKTRIKSANCPLGKW